MSAGSATGRASQLATLAAGGLTALAAGTASAEPESLEIGLTRSGEPITGLRVEAAAPDASRVAVVAGLDGQPARSLVRDVERYAERPEGERAVELTVIMDPNPDGAELVFPPTGPAYRENAESHALWRWLGLHGPDLLIVVGADRAGLAEAAATTDVAGVAPIPSRRVAALEPGWADRLDPGLPTSPARATLLARRERTPLEFANMLAPIYGQSFDPPLYIDGMGLIAHLGFGHIGHVTDVVGPYVDGARDSLAGRFGTSALVVAGHLVFAELARRTGDSRYVERVRAAADLAFDDDGSPLPAMPGHGEMSDSVFMGAAILAAAGELTGDTRYFDMAARHITFMNALVRRNDALYRHSPLTDAAWGRGNGFAAIGYALTLSSLPEDHPAHAPLLDEYEGHMSRLRELQNDDGTWRQVVDHPGAYHETSSTAIIGFSMQRGIDRGWLDAAEFGPIVERAWRGVLTRTDDAGRFIDVSESTNKQPSLDAYLGREALYGTDPRTGSFAMLFAVERAGGFAAD